MSSQHVSTFIENAPEEQREILAKLRNMIHRAVPESIENFKWGRPVFSSPKDFAYLKISKSYVTLGFFTSRGISDSEGILEGTGKDMRHIKIRSLNDIRQELFESWLHTVSKSINEA
jgi:hypothetical protein